jgi:hypothetical protein
MAGKSAEEYREEARRIRKLAMGTTSQIVQGALLNVATYYDELARSADFLAALDTPEFQSGPLSEGAKKPKQ